MGYGRMRNRSRAVGGPVSAFGSHPAGIGWHLVRVHSGVARSHRTATYGPWPSSTLPGTNGPAPSIDRNAPVRLPVDRYSRTHLAPLLHLSCTRTVPVHPVRKAFSRGKTGGRVVTSAPWPPRPGVSCPQAGHCPTDVADSGHAGGGVATTPPAHADPFRAGPVRHRHPRHAPLQRAACGA